MADDPNIYRNLFLKVLPARDLALLRPSLQFVELKQGDLLGEPGLQVADVLFVESGMVSLLTTMQDGTAIEIATLGRESVLGATYGHVSDTTALETLSWNRFRRGGSDFEKGRY